MTYALLLVLLCLPGAFISSGGGVLIGLPALAPPLGLLICLRLLSRGTLQQPTAAPPGTGSLGRLPRLCDHALLWASAGLMIAGAVTIYPRTWHEHLVSNFSAAFVGY